MIETPSADGMTSASLAFLEYLWLHRSMTSGAGALFDVEDVDSDEFNYPSDELEMIGTETEGDLDHADSLDFRKVVTAPTDWTVQTILSQLQNHSFELDPDFQRRNAWTDSRKSKFIESLILGLPIPQIIFAEKDNAEDDAAAYVVIDGKQRLLAIEAFYDEARPLRLSGLTVLKQLNGKVRSEIADDAALSRYVKRLQNQTVRTVVIRSWPDDSFLHLVFHRINHQALALSAQELRQALNPGPFTRFVDRHAGASEPLHKILGATQIPDFRMRDVELLVRFLGFQLRITDYRGNLKRFLDDTCAYFNTTWDQHEDLILRMSDACDTAVQATEEIFEAKAFRRFVAGRYETRFNRAVFDAMLHYFVHPVVIDESIRNRSAVIEAYELLSTTDDLFARSVTSTTKTQPATIYRIGAWGGALSRAIGMDLRRPRLIAATKEVVFEGHAP